KGRTASAAVTMTVTPVADPPIVTAQQFTITEEQLLSAQLVASDADGDQLTFALNQAPTHGQLTLAADGSFTYQPTANFVGRDSFVFRVSDGATVVPATVEIVVASANDAPLAIDDDVRLDQGSSVQFDVRGNDSDVDGDALRVELLSPPASGQLLAQADGSFVYTPIASFSGEDSFTYRLSDGLALSGVATVRLQVAAVNQAPVAEDDSATTDEDTPVTVTVLANDRDPDGDALVVALLTPPQHGSAVAHADGSITYTPAADFFGADQFSYSLRDDQGRAASASVAVTVTALADAPQVVAQQFTTTEDQLLSAQLVASDADGDVLTFALQQAPAHGQLTLAADGSFTYQPAANHFGNDSFAFSVSDGATLVPATVELQIAPVNDVPVASDDVVELTQGSSASFDVRSNDSDVDGDALTVELLSTPGSGQLLAQTDGRLTYAPAASFSGEDSFQYRISDGQVLSAVASVRLRVAAVNQAPVAEDDSATTDEDTPVAIDVLANDRDLNKDTLALTAMTQPAHGTAVIENGVIRYTPAANYHGADVFQYTVRNDKGHTATASASVAVFAVNDTPTVAFIADRLVLEGESLSFSVDATDVDGDSLSYQLLGSGATLDSSGRFHLTALDGDASLSFTIQVSDGASVAERDFTLTLANVAPTLTVAGAESVAGGQPYTIQLAASDPGDDAIQFWRVSWGDGESEILPADARQASHLYSRAGGRFTVEAYAEDEDGAYAATPRSVTVAPDLLQVESFTPTPSGFAVRFDHVFNRGAIQLNDPLGAADVQLVGDLVGEVSGSLVFDADGRGFRFLRSGGILPFDHYRVRLASGDSGFHDEIGALDGNGDGTPGDDYQTQFDFRSSGAAILSLPDFMRGPGQAVDVPATGKRLPVSMTSAGGLRSLVFTIDYDPRLLAINGAQPAAGLPPGSELRFETAARDSGGQRARVTVILPGETTLAAGTVRLVDLVAEVPASAPYGAKQILALAVEQVNGGAPEIASVATDDALHLVGYFGDTSGNAAYSTLDGQQIQRVLVKLDAGFAAYPNVDPLLVADINGSGTLTSLDASRVLQEVSYLTGASTIDRLEIPPIPEGVGPIRFAGPDPRVDLPIDAMANPGEQVTVPVRIDTSAGLASVQLRMVYDVSRFELVAVRRGSLTGDFAWFVTSQEPGRIVVDMSRLEALQGGAGTLLEVDLRVKAGAQPGVSPIDLQYVSLNDGRLTLGVVPQVGADATDGRVTVSDAGVLLAVPEVTLAATAASPGAAGVLSATPVVDLNGRFALPPAVEQAILTSSRNRTWLKDYLDGAGQARKAAPSSTLKVSVPTSAAATRSLSSGGGTRS
ncbi:MAG TPA: Ig-like domain-containing protein, partial [Accumulibacter sp.]|uniref:Ig-like domain-containing protein n=1 Tax=Accumulibacter sp. TaxID=2053492 RepID=UPI002BB3D6DE